MPYHIQILKVSFMRKIPNLKPNLYIIVEGYADKNTLSKIIKEFDLKYNVKIIDALGSGNIVNRYLDYISKYPYSKILVFYDLDGNKTLKDIKKIFEDKDIDIDSNFIYFVNPLIEFLWFISKKKQAIKWTQKKDFVKFIEREFNVLEYKGTKRQIDKIINQLNSNDINNMFNNIKKIIGDKDCFIPSTNILKLKELLEKEEK